MRFEESSYTGAPRSAGEGIQQIPPARPPYEPLFLPALRQAIVEERAGWGMQLPNGVKVGYLGLSETYLGRHVVRLIGATNPPTYSDFNLSHAMVMDGDPAHLEPALLRHAAAFRPPGPPPVPDSITFRCD